jgi:TolB protein
MTKGRWLWAAAISLAVALAGAGCTGLPVVAPQVEAYQTPVPDKIEKAQATVTLVGKVLVAKEGNIWLLTQDSFKQISSGGKSRQPVWSPDGGRIAFVQVDGNSSDIWVMNADGSGAKVRTPFKSANLRASHWAFQPVWSPDGSQIAYVSEEASFDLALWVMNADGSGRRQVALLDAYTGGLDTPSYSPDGLRVAFTAYRNGSPQIWSLTLKTGAWTQLSKNGGGSYDAAWSPDGTHIAYVARENGKNDVWVMGEDGSAPVKVSTSGLCRSPAWSPDGTSLAYLNGQGGYFDLWMVKVSAAAGTIKVGEAEQVTKNAQLDPASGISWNK